MDCIQVKKLEWNYVHAIADSGSYGEKVCKGKEGKEKHELSYFRPYWNIISNRVITHFTSSFYLLLFFLQGMEAFRVAAAREKVCIDGDVHKIGRRPTTKEFEFVILTS